MCKFISKFDSTTIHIHKMNDISKLEATQNIIRNKFKKAHSNRIKNEHDVNRAIQPLTAAADSSASVDSETNNSSLQAPSIHSSAKNNSSAIKTNEQQDRDPNALCDILRILLTPLPDFSDIECMQRINAILDELRRLEIIF